MCMLLRGMLLLKARPLSKNQKSRERRKSLDFFFTTQDLFPRTKIQPRKQCPCESTSKVEPSFEGPKNLILKRAIEIAMSLLSSGLEIWDQMTEVFRKRGCFEEANRLNSLLGTRQYRIKTGEIFLDRKNGP